MKNQKSCSQNDRKSPRFAINNILHSTSHKPDLNFDSKFNDLEDFIYLVSHIKN